MSNIKSEISKVLGLIKGFNTGTKSSCTNALIVYHEGKKYRLVIEDLKEDVETEDEMWDDIDRFLPKSQKI